MRWACCCYLSDHIPEGHNFSRLFEIAGYIAGCNIFSLLDRFSLVCVAGSERYLSSNDTDFCIRK